MKFTDKEILTALGQVRIHAPLPAGIESSELVVAALAVPELARDTARATDRAALMAHLVTNRIADVVLGGVAAVTDRVKEDIEANVRASVTPTRGLHADLVIVDEDMPEMSLDLPTVTVPREMLTGYPAVRPIPVPGMPGWYGEDEPLPANESSTYVPPQQLTPGGPVHGGFTFIERDPQWMADGLEPPVPPLLGEVIERAPSLEDLRADNAAQRAAHDRPTGE